MFKTDIIVMHSFQDNANCETDNKEGRSGRGREETEKEEGPLGQLSAGVMPQETSSRNT